ncbi:hypothetical protein JK636_23250 [Clostridium sp. YIM B02515]|uniref:Alpha-L-rhamnosidase six-hairpin glycosidase domain-containing protein n=1 Tax=Clostridium rhizosphaerae TaxID=2803861 RepID=A0ABS1TGW5_9CLOT|nr:hypothetical protein [Clostridium rhizosphaerae]MBL4938626.1 hypothetical protein [Clostridium rhizosphaerae]
MELNRVSIKSSNAKLVEGFNWAKEKALKYVNTNDPVGLWYEASLPGRDAFCMRDVSHQSTGAQILGLSSFNKNMLKKFAKNISKSRDWCSYWEINKYNLPAPEDYKTDDDFWYNLPANFDVLDCCYRQYLWTGDLDYINDPGFLNFYERTVKDYVKCWDINNDGFLEYKGDCIYRGIPSYLEGQVGVDKIISACDMLSAQYRGYLSYSKIQRLRGNNLEAKEHEEKAENVKRMFNTKWWNENKNNYNTFILENGEFYGVSENDAEKSGHLVTTLPLYFDIVEGKQRVDNSIKVLLSCKNINVETESHYPEVLYKYGFDKEAYDFIMDLVSPLKKRREYPEVSYSVVGSIITGMVGIKPDATKKLIESTPRLTEDVEWIEIDNIPIFNNEISIKCVGNKEAVFINKGKDTVLWKAVFSTNSNEFMIDGTKVKAQKEEKSDGSKCSYVVIPVHENEQHHVKII